MADRPTRVREKRERNPDETRRRILEAAEDEFAKKGYDGARMRELAKNAGVNHALLHHYFGDKQSLFRAVVEHAFAHVSAGVYEQMRRHGDLDGLIPAYVTMLVEFHTRRPNLARLLHLASMDPESPAYHAIGEVTRYIGAPLQEAIAKALEQGVREGKVRDDIDPRRLVALTMGAVSYVFLEEHFFRDFLGGDVREPKACEAHSEAALAFVRSAIFRPPVGT